MSLLNPIDDPSYNASGSSNAFGQSPAAPTGSHTSTSGFGHSSRNPLDSTSSSYGSSGTNITSGPHTSNVANEMDPRVDSDRSSTAVPSATNLGHASSTSSGVSGYDRTTGPVYGSAGFHTSNIANEADPRVDSDMSSGRNLSTHDRTTGPASSTAGPHTSNVANEADPRVDSDLDSTAERNNPSRDSRTTGPHTSHVANEADPRVDGDMSSARNTSTATNVPTDSSSNVNPKDTHINTSLPNALGHEGNMRNSVTGEATEGVAGVIPIEGNAGPTTTKVFEPHAHANGGDPARSGPHSSGTANKTDPRVDSDRDNRARHEEMASSSYNTPGSGRASGTAGAHDSNVGNKMDPTVDSDMDGSRQRA